MRFLSDNLNNNPAVRGFKNMRNRWINDLYLKFNPRDIIFPQNWNPINHREICFSIAFNKPVCIEILIKSWQQCCKDLPLVIVDNSSNKIDRIQTMELCKTAQTPYIGLPTNVEWSPNRSHALALNWIYHNIVLKWRPELFGFLDFDCFPFSEFNLSKAMDNINVFGSKRQSIKNPNCFNIWPGFSFYRLSRVLDFKINFTHSIELGLDTGGSNWFSFYSKLQPDEFLFVETDLEIVKNLSSELVLSGVIFNSFLHIGSAGHKKKQINTDHLYSLLNRLSAIRKRA